MTQQGAERESPRPVEALAVFHLEMLLCSLVALFVIHHTLTLMHLPMPILLNPWRTKRLNRVPLGLTLRAHLLERPLVERLDRSVIIDPAMTMHHPSPSSRFCCS
jgi:hypothetical protein